jgi:hypothetical protein
MIYTDEGKTGEAAPPTRLITDVSYLKRKFRFDNEKQVWDAPLDLGTILEECNWIRGDVDQKYATLENCSNAIRELSNYDSEVFSKYVKVINDACLCECGELPPQQTYEGYWMWRSLEYFTD